MSHTLSRLGEQCTLQGQGIRIKRFILKDVLQPLQKVDFGKSVRTGMKGEYMSQRTQGTHNLTVGGGDSTLYHPGGLGALEGYCGIL